ncbi:hypothetical protein DFH09DRAFT_1376521 [Mycena vulgaris]|nr:hypothetical protein DFH09DRAFT_1376521 [Mycena vulgaris]
MRPFPIVVGSLIFPALAGFEPFPDCEIVLQLTMLMESALMSIISLPHYDLRTRGLRTDQFLDDVMAVITATHTGLLAPPHPFRIPPLSRCPDTSTPSRWRDVLANSSFVRAPSVRASSLDISQIYRCPVSGHLLINKHRRHDTQRAT